jgi:tRNA pseudouridine38-40 synthase
MRYFIELSYNGTQYHGWQIQANAHTVQQEINNALIKLLRAPVSSTGSGRTDTGVHALQQYLMFNWEEEFDIPHLLFRLNNSLPKDIAIHRIIPVGEKAHVRFDATHRTYHYVIARKKMAHHEKLSTSFYHPLKVELMQEACTMLVANRDFQSFSLVNTAAKTFICDIEYAHWTQRNDWLIFEIKANRFLRGMVRAIVGTMLKIGRERMSLEQFQAVIDSKDRKQAAMAAPPDGLYLTHVDYPDTVIPPPPESPLHRLPILYS